MNAGAAARAGAAAALALACAAAAAGSSGLEYCDRAAAVAPREQDRLFRFAAIVRAELEAAGDASALLARSGRNLSRFGQRYSHAGVSLRASDNAPWSVRQLYYACDERAPRLFDQGIAGFVLGTDDAALGYVSIVLLPPAEARALARRALDNADALRLLGAEYSANAYAFGLRYQNCNQWVAELLALAWGGIEGGSGDARAAAQDWLRERDYAPTLFDADSLLLILARPFVPWVHVDDHPAADRARRHYRVSMPASIEAFVRDQVPEARRIELCHAGSRVVVHRGWDAIAEGCVPGDGDRVIELD